MIIFFSIIFFTIVVLFAFASRYGCADNPEDYTVEEHAKQKYSNDAYIELDEESMEEAIEMFQSEFREFSYYIGHPELYEIYERTGKIDNRQIEAAIKSASNEGYLFYRDGKFVVCFGKLSSYREI